MYFLADNKIGEAGAASLIVGLFESQAIVKLNLESGEQINRMEKNVHHHYFIFRMQDWRCRSNVVGWNVEIKHISCSAQLGR